MLIGIVGKPSAGKSTLLNALAHTDAKVGNYPFTTIDPNKGVGYVGVPCPAAPHGLTCEPRVGSCDGITRLVPVELLDVAGLVPGASEGKGLGNKFLDDLRTADVLIHVVDTSGSLDAEGNPVEKGSWDPLQDVEWLELEIAQWIKAILSKDWSSLTRKAEAEKVKLADLLYQKLSGLKIRKSHIQTALRKLQQSLSTPPTQWTDNDLLLLAKLVREASKPIIIAANKIDQPTSEANFQRLKEKYGDLVIPLSALTEVILQDLAEKGIIEYSAGAAKFSVKKQLPPKQQELLTRIQTDILDKYGSTGVQDLLRKAVFDILQMVVCYPVEDVKKLCDGDGRVLPDAFLVPKGTTAREFAGKVHTQLQETFIYAVLAPSGRRIGEDYEIQHGDIIKIVAAAK